jgi:nucleotide-binding universal stress UspA family protein
MFQVLLPVDSDDDRAIAAAEAVVSLPNAPEEVHVTILNVEEEFEVSTEGGSVRSEDWYDETNFPSSVEQSSAYLTDAGVSVKQRRVHGDPAKAILDVADEIKADRIIMCGQKRTTVGKVLLGSVTQSVLLNAEIPVTVVYART